MKKLLALLLALVFCVAPLVSCGDDATETGTGTGTETTADAETGAYDVKSAAAFLKNMYKQYLTAPETTKDFTLVSQVMNGGVAYTVTWTTDNEAIKVIADEANKQVTIDVNEKTPEVINYKLTATVADPAGATEKVEFALSVPACAFAPEEGTAYKFYLTQAIAGKVLYVDGGISGGRYLTMTDDFTKALDFFVEASGNGYKFFTTIDGAKKYVDIFTNDEGKTAVGYADSSDCVYTYNSATFAWEAEVDGVAYYLGTYSNYETVSASKTSYITVENTRVSQFPMEFTTEKVEYEAPETPDEPEQPEDPSVIIGGTANADVVAAPKAGTAYKFYFYQSKVGKALYIDGGTNQDRYLTTTTDFAKALNVYVESANGGYKFYVTIDGAKKYIDLSLNAEGKAALSYADSTNCAFKYNKETFAWEVAAGEETYYLGTYNTFETVSASKTSYINKDNTRKEQFPLELVTKAVTITPSSTPDEPEQPENPKPPVDEKVPAADNGSYKLYIDQVKAKKILYIDGGIDQDRYLTMTEDYSKALTAKFEAVKGGYKISVTINGAKKYIDVYTNADGKIAIRYAASTNCVFNENKTTKAWETTVDGTAYYLGTYGTFLTVSASKTSYITAENTGKEQFPLVKTTKEITPYPAEQPTTPPVEEDKTPAADNGTYRLYLDQVKAKKILYLDGGVKDDRYLTMTDDYSKAITAKFEAVKGGYKIAVTIGGAKKYIDVYKNEAGKDALRYADTTNCVFNENKDTKAWETVVDGTAFYLGTYSTFDTVSASKTSYITAENTGKDQFPLVKTTKEITPYPAEEPETPSTPSTPSTPATAPVVGKAYKLESTNSSGALYFTGVKNGSLTTATAKAQGLDVYIEAATGDEYYIYYMEAGVKTYLSLDQSKTTAFKTYADKASAKTWKFNAEIGSLVSADFGRFIGTDLTRSDMRAYADSNAADTTKYSVAKFVAA